MFLLCNNVNQKLQLYVVWYAIHVDFLRFVLRLMQNTVKQGHVLHNNTQASLLLHCG